MRHLLNTLLAVLPLYAFAQDYPDCNQALQICSKGKLHFSLATGPGELNELENLSCYPGANQEFAPTWISWEIAQGGTLEFVLTPDEGQADLDFYVFRLPAPGQCENKEEIRCMASGENVGAPISEWIQCTGPTGLLPGNTDTAEQPGCQGGDNNFLAPLETQAGEAYVLLVENFSGAGGFTMDLCGSALLPCDTSDCTTLVSVEEPGHAKINIFPNPSTSGIFTLQWPESNPGKALVEIYTATGQLVYRRSLPPEQREAQIELNGSPDGLYILRWQSKTGYSVERFIIQNKP